MIEMEMYVWLMNNYRWLKTWYGVGHNWFYLL